jgi:hypothetical protein
VCRHYGHHGSFYTYIFGMDIQMVRREPPNKSPEQAAVAACSSTVAVHTANRRLLASRSLVL